MPVYTYEFNSVIRGFMLTSICGHLAWVTLLSLRNLEEDRAFDEWAVSATVGHIYPLKIPKCAVFFNEAW